MLNTIGSLHHESLVGISREEGSVSRSDIELVDGVEVGLEAIGLVRRVEVDGDASGRHVEMVRMKAYDTESRWRSGLGRVKSDGLG